MRKTFLLSCAALVLALFGAANAQAQENLVSKYFTNADFSSTEGWTSKTGETSETAMGAIGTLKVNNVQSTTDENHTADMFCAGISARWNTNFAAWEQVSSAIPAGKYTLTFDVQNPGKSKSYKMGNLTYVKVGETTYNDNGMTADAIIDATGWTQHTITFTVSSESAVTLSLGYKNNENKGSAETPELFFSNLKLVDALIPLKTELDETIKAAETQLATYDESAAWYAPLAAAIVEAKTTVDKTKEESLTTGISNLKAAMDKAALDYKRSFYATIADGKYYIKNVASGKFLSNGAYWGTRAVFSEAGLEYGVKQNTANGKYTLTSNIKSKDTDGADLRPSDGFNNQSGEWEVIATGEEGKVLLFNGTQYFYYDGSSDVPVFTKDKTDANAVWQFVTAEDRKNQVVPGSDATVFISDADFILFNKNSTNWKGSPAISGESLQGTNIANNSNAQKWNAGTFDVYQEIEGLPNGVYTLSAQAFYRHGNSKAGLTAYEAGDENPGAYLYANGAEVKIKSIYSEAKTAAEGGWAAASGSYYIPNTQSNAAYCFSAGAYVNKIYNIYVTDGKMRIGVKREGDVIEDWTVFDQFRLTYERELSEYDNAYLAAIAGVEAKLGFDKGEYAPYNNIDNVNAVKTMIGTSKLASDADVQEVTNNIINLDYSTWNKNSEIMNAVYDGYFEAKTATADATAAGKEMTDGGWTANGANYRQIIGEAATYPALTQTENGKAVYTWGSTFKYGEKNGYTMPLGAHTVYEFKIKYSGWNGANNGFSVSVLNKNGEGLAQQNLGKAEKGPQSEGGFVSKTLKFTTGEAGNYILSVIPNGNSTWCDIDIRQVPETSVKMSIVDGVNYSTFIAPFDVDIPSGVTAKQVSEYKDGKITYSEVENTIPANTPVLLHSASAVSEEFKGQSVAIMDTYSDGYLTGCYVLTGAPVGSYLLQKQNDKVGWYKVAAEGLQCGVNRAYLTVPAEGATGAPQFIALDGEATAISDVKAERSAKSVEAYDLTGRRVSAQSKGLYIINGKKIVK